MGVTDSFPNLQQMSELVHQQLPSYSPSSLPPTYSSDILEGEETLAYTSRFHSLSHPTGIYSKHVGDVTIRLSEQNERADVPSYGRGAMIAGSINMDSSLKVEDIVEVVLKVEGKIKLDVSGTNPMTKTVRTVDLSYELWSCHAPNSSASAVCPRSVPFLTVLPTTFKDGDREFSLPPSYEVNFTGISGFHVKCTYAICAIVKTRGPLWNHKKTARLPFTYLPRKRAPQPIVPIHFLSTVKTSPEEWYQATSVLEARASTGLAPIDVSLFIPAVRIFGLQDRIPYHIQLAGPIASLKEFYSHGQYEPEGSSSFTPIRSRTNNLTLTMSVALRRQVRVEPLKGQSVWKSSAIGSGTLNALPPSFELDTDPNCSSSEMTLDWEGEVKCLEDVRVGHFDAGKLSATDFLMLSIASKSNQGAFRPLCMIVPVSLVTDTWVE